MTNTPTPAPEPMSEERLNNVESIFTPTSEVASFLQGIGLDLVAEVRRLRAADDPQWDCTDYAHPAWWRGHEYSATMITRRIAKVLDGLDDGAGTVNFAELETVRRRIMALMKLATASPRKEGE